LEVCLAKSCPGVETYLDTKKTIVSHIVSFLPLNYPPSVLAVLLVVVLVVVLLCSRHRRHPTAAATAATAVGRQAGCRLLHEPRQQPQRGYGPPLPHPRRRNGNKGGGRVKAEATKWAITTATRVASNDNGTGDGGKSDGNGDEGLGRATMRAMVVATTVAAMRVASNEEDEGAGQTTTMAMAVATTVAAMRVASDKEGESGKVMETVTRLAGKQRQRR
jgi:hypothetical protein